MPARTLSPGASSALGRWPHPSKDPVPKALLAPLPCDHFSLSRGDSKNGASLPGNLLFAPFRKCILNEEMQWHLQERPWSWLLGAQPAGPPSSWEVAVGLPPLVDPRQAGSAPNGHCHVPGERDGCRCGGRGADGRGRAAGPGSGAGGWLFGELPPREVLCALHASVGKPPAEERASSHPPIGALSSELPGVVSQAPPAAASVRGEPAHIHPSRVCAPSPQLLQEGQAAGVPPVFLARSPGRVN